MRGPYIAMYHWGDCSHAGHEVEYFNTYDEAKAWLFAQKVEWGGYYYYGMGDFVIIKAETIEEIDE